MPVPKPATKVDADELHNAMRHGAMSEIVKSIAETQIGFTIALPGIPQGIRKTLREHGMHAVTTRFLTATLATYPKTFGAQLPDDLRGPFVQAYEVAAASFIEAWLASNEVES